MISNINKIYSKYKGFWIAVEEDYSRVYAYSKSLDELTDKIKKKKQKKGVIMRVPTERFSAYVG